MNSLEEITIRSNVEAYMEQKRREMERALEICPEDLQEHYAYSEIDYEQHVAMWAPVYARMMDYMPEKVREFLDLGCGEGKGLHYLFQKYPDIYVTAIDTSREMLEKLETRYNNQNVEVIRADYFKRLFPKEAYDVVNIVGSLHHADANRKKRFFEKIYKILKPGGRYIESDIYACCDAEEELLRTTYIRLKEKWKSTHREMHFDTPLTVRKEAYLLRIAGFREVQIYPAFEGAATIVAIKNE